MINTNWVSKSQCSVLVCKKHLIFLWGGVIEREKSCCYSYSGGFIDCNRLEGKTIYYFCVNYTFLFIYCTHEKYLLNLKYSMIILHQNRGLFWTTTNDIQVTIQYGIYNFGLLICILCNIDMSLMTWIMVIFPRSDYRVQTFNKQDHFHNFFTRHSLKL